MTPYLFTHNDWSPYPATVQQSYPKTTLLGVEMTVTEDRCDVTAVIATRFSTVSDGPMQTFGTNIEGGRFPGLKKM